MDSWGTFTISCSSCRRVLLCLAFLAWVAVQQGIAVFEFAAADHTEAFGKSLQQVAGDAHILGKSWSSPSLEVNASVLLETSEKLWTGEFFTTAKCPVGGDSVYIKICVEINLL